MANWILRRVPSPFNGKKNGFSANGVGTTGFPNAKELN